MITEELLTVSDHDSFLNLWPLTRMNCNYFYSSKNKDLKIVKQSPTIIYFYGLLWPLGYVFMISYILIEKKAPLK